MIRYFCRQQSGNVYGEFGEHETYYLYVRYIGIEYSLFKRGLQLGATEFKLEITVEPIFYTAF